MPRNLHRDCFTCTCTAIATLVPLGIFTFVGKTVGAQYRLITPGVMQMYWIPGTLSPWPLSHIWYSTGMWRQIWLLFFCVERHWLVIMETLKHSGFNIWSVLHWFPPILLIIWNLFFLHLNMTSFCSIRIQNIAVYVVRRKLLFLTW
jgi:hypothetical protein